MKHIIRGGPDKHATVQVGRRVRPGRLARRVGKTLEARGWMLVAAESCTGGGIAEWMTRIPGSSDWFERGYVTYSDDAKMELLDVKRTTLAHHGAVSEMTVREMAAGALRHSHAQIAVAVTGIAGPGGGTPDKPVGTVCLGWADHTGELISVQVQLAGNRLEVRRQSVVLALTGVLDIVGG